jgi:hypothetical protein
MKMLELNITAQCSCMTLKVHLLKRVFLYLTISMDHTKMMPPELLHTSDSRLIMYMFESLRDQKGGGKDRDLIDRQHILISNLIKRQSECDFLRGSLKNGLIDETKCQSLEQKGNLFQLLCIAHTTNGSHVMKRSLQYSDAKWK